jgi:hypothetical protein
VANASPSPSSVDAYRSAVTRENAAIDRYNANVGIFNRTLTMLKTLARQEQAAVAPYDREETRCLAAIPDWDLATSALSASLVAPAQAAGNGPVPTVQCESPAQASATPQRSRYAEQGYVARGSEMIVLSPSTCFALQEAITQPGPLACAAVATATFSPTCSIGATDELSAIVTLAHEQQHVDGESDEATAQCYAYQKAATTSRKLGLPDNVARHVALVVNGSIIQPRRYRTSQCHDGGRLDLRLADAPPSWTYG